MQWVKVWGDARGFTPPSRHPRTNADGSRGCVQKRRSFGKKPREAALIGAGLAVNDRLNWAQNVLTVKDWRINFHSY